MRRYLPTFFLVVAAVCSPFAQAQSPAVLNLARSTLRGDQFWTDQLVYGKWRIQRNEITNHFRLLDPANVRRAWGDEQECRAAFDSLRREAAIPMLSGKALITLHGFGGTREAMGTIGQQLEKDGNYAWINVSYASTRNSLDENAQSLACVIESLDGIEEIHLVCHSVGNLVVRRYLGEASQPQPRWKSDPRITRMVMLAPPNNGAQFARVAAELLHDNQVVRLIAGPSAWQLARKWDDAQKELATPGFEFGIVAGGFGNSGLNPLLEGDDDWVVTVAETRLPGAADFRLVSCRHDGLLRDPIVQQQTLNFLKHGCFTTAAERQPIPFPEPISPIPAAAGQ